MTTLLTTGAALAASLTSTKAYDATAKLLVSDAEPIDVVTQSNGRSQDPERDLNTGIELVKLNDVAQAVLDRVGRPMSASELLNHVEVGPEGNSNVLGITVRDSSPSRAAALADAFAEEYVTIRRESARVPYRRAVASARERLEALSPAERAGAEARALTHRINELKVASTVQTGGVQVVNRATEPANPATPRTRLNVVAALLAGVFLGCVFAFGLDRWRSNSLALTAAPSDHVDYFYSRRG